MHYVLIGRLPGLLPGFTGLTLVTTESAWNVKMWFAVLNSVVFAFSHGYSHEIHILHLHYCMYAFFFMPEISEILFSFFPFFSQNEMKDPRLCHVLFFLLSMTTSVLPVMHLQGVACPEANSAVSLLHRFSLDLHLKKLKGRFKMI